MTNQEAPGAFRTLHVHIPDVQEVYLMGEFNDWSTTATPLVRLGDGLWEARLSVTHALRRLCFFVWEQGQSFGRFIDAEPRIDEPVLL